MSVPPPRTSLRLAAEGILPATGELEISELWGADRTASAGGSTGPSPGQSFGQRLAARVLPRRELPEPDWNREIARYGRRVVVSLVARGVALERAQELAQEAWMRLIEKQRNGELRELSLPGLVFRQAQYLAQDDYRKSQRREKIAEAAGWSKQRGAAESADMEQQIDARSQLAIVQRVLASKAPRVQLVFQRLHGQDTKKCAAEIAGELGISVQRVRQIACELRAEIRRALEENFDV